MLTTTTHTHKIATTEWISSSIDSVCDEVECDVYIVENMKSHQTQLISGKRCILIDNTNTRITSNRSTYILQPQPPPHPTHSITNPYDPGYINKSEAPRDIANSSSSHSPPIYYIQIVGIGKLLLWKF